MDFTLYWFMFPVSIVVATCAMLSGIGGAALFTPIFVLVLPLLGPDYVLQSTFAAIGTALLTQTFGFLSGFVGYYRRRMIDFGLAWTFIRIAVPVAVVGSFAGHLVHDSILIGGYALLITVLAAGLMRREYSGTGDPKDTNPSARHLTTRLDSLAVGAGAFLTGMVSVGIGEVTVSRLAKRGIPIATAAATSVAVVITTVVFASSTIVAQLIRESGFAAVPWNLVCYSIPGVIIGGQIGPRLQGLTSRRTMERSIATLFLGLAIAMLAVALRKAGIR